MAKKQSGSNQPELQEEEFRASDTNRRETEKTKDASAEEPEKETSTIDLKSADFQNIHQDTSIDRNDIKLDLLMDLSLPVSIELGRTQLLIKDILSLKRGSVVEFEKLASEPVDILINGKKMAEGEVVVIEKHFGIRITNLMNTADRVRSLGA
jgi:flagellar motor switch protein FliN